MTTPIWYDDSKLRRIKFEIDESGWAIDMENGTYRLANTPIRGAVGRKHPELPQWGDLVKLCPNNGSKSWLEIIEKYQGRIKL